MDRAEVTAYLRTVPEVIEEVLQGLSDDDFCCRPSPDEWSILEVCCHLRDYSRIEGQRVRRLVEEDEPALQAWDEQQLARERQYAEDDPRRVRTALRTFWGGLAYQLEGLRTSSGSAPARTRRSAASPSAAVPTGRWSMPGST